MSTAAPSSGASGLRPRSEIFSWPRWLLLVRARWTEQRRQYAAHMLVTAILYCVLLVLVLWSTDFKGFTTEAQSGLYFGGLYITGCVFAGRYFQAMARRESALQALMLPASLCEKWLLCLLLVALVYPLFYSLLFLAISWPVQQLVLAALPQGPAIKFDPRNYALFVPFVDVSENSPAQPQWGLLIGLWILQALAVSGTLYFQRAAMLKTQVLIFGLLVFSSIWWIAVDARGEVIFAWWMLDGGSGKPLTHVINSLLWIGLPILLWLQVFLHLKERELL
ncbi:hypothetical protein [Verminephrobacter aporrectodeae]|uniref:hypothetical protein n=1 Tax=Verminephrobacter aporrectodeae TaxID=1110389 RepID=UPI0022387EFE|nr:hypothetical protein [Verminephrobacter aporrectodeae]